MAPTRLLQRSGHRRGLTIRQPLVRTDRRVTHGRWNRWPAALLLISTGLTGCAAGLSPEARLQEAFRRSTGRIELPAGTVEINTALQLAPGAHDLEIAGSPRGTTLRMSNGFQGKAAIAGTSVARVLIHGFRITGARTTLITDKYLPPANLAFAAYYEGNGLLLADSSAITIRDVAFERIRNFPVLISHCTGVSITGVSIADSGSLNARGHNNTSGGILLEEGTSGFSVTRCNIRNICGNGIWTHSNANSPRNRDGEISGNKIAGTARDAIQLGHAVRVKALNNEGSQIGRPPSQIDVESLATPVALDSAGNVEQSLFSGNRFTDVDGQCIDLDGFHDGEVVDNSCINRKPLSAYPFLHTGIVFGNSSPEMHPGAVLVSNNVIEGFGYGGIFLIGEGSRIIGNRFIDINRNHCKGDGKVPACNYALEEPGMLRSGIYLASHAARPAETRGNIIRNNFISGFGARQWCVAAGPGVNLPANRIDSNQCVDLP